MTTLFIPLRSITIPSHSARPAQSWPPPRTDNGRSQSLTARMADWTSCTVRQWTTARGIAPESPHSKSRHRATRRPDARHSSDRKLVAARRQVSGRGAAILLWRYSWRLRRNSPSSFAIFAAIIRASSLVSNFAPSGDHLCSRQVCFSSVTDGTWGRNDVAIRRHAL